MVDLDTASTDDLVEELLKRQKKYEDYKVKYWRINSANISDPYDPEYVIASTETEAIEKLSKFFEKKYDTKVQLYATLLTEAEFSEIVVKAKARYEEYESLKTQFKKENDI